MDFCNCCGQKIVRPPVSVRVETDADGVLVARLNQGGFESEVIRPENIRLSFNMYGFKEITMVGSRILPDGSFVFCIKND